MGGADVRLRTWALVVLVVGSVLGIGAWARARVPGASASDRGPSRVIFAPQSVPIRFHHAKHARLNLDCLFCHPRARTSTRVGDSLLAKPDSCDPCHGSNHTTMTEVRTGPDPDFGGCAVCHEGYEAGHGNTVRRVVVPTAELRFSHRVHAARNIGCGQCHGSVQRVGLAGRTHLPRMRGCFACHNLPADSRGDAKAGCSTCHKVGHGGRLRTRLSTGKMLPPAWLGAARHGPDFAHRHGRAAANNSRFCANCHGEDDCMACHDGRIRPRNIHPNDFLSMHPVAARQNAQKCTSCHRQATFCKPCHMRAGVTMTGPAWARRSQGRVHPPRAVYSQRPVTSRHHATEARRNLGSCVSCHVERDCVVCHAGGRGGGVGVNPHPAGFSSRCASAWARNPRPCLVCHEPDEMTRCR